MKQVIAIKHADAYRQLVTFMVGTEAYGLPIEEVYQILTVPSITSLPNASAALRGIVNLRSESIPVVDARALFGLPEAPPSKKQRLIIIKTDQCGFGLIVDSVTEVLRTENGTIEEIPPVLVTRRNSYINCLFKNEIRMVLLIDADRMLQEAECPVA